MLSLLSRVVLITMISLIVAVVVMGVLSIAVLIGSNALRYPELHPMLLLIISFCSITTGLVTAALIWRGRPMTSTEILNKLRFR